MKRARSLKIHIMLKLFSLLADVGHTIDTLLADVGHTIDTFIIRPHIMSILCRHLVALNYGKQIWTYPISVEEEEPGDPYSCQALLASLSAPGDRKINHFLFSHLWHRL